MQSSLILLFNLLFILLVHNICTHLAQFWNILSPFLHPRKSRRKEGGDFISMSWYHALNVIHCANNCISMFISWCAFNCFTHSHTHEVSTLMGSVPFILYFIANGISSNIKWRMSAVWKKLKNQCTFRLCISAVRSCGCQALCSSWAVLKAYDGGKEEDKEGHICRMPASAPPCSGEGQQHQVSCILCFCNHTFCWSWAPVAKKMAPPCFTCRQLPNVGVRCFHPTHEHTQATTGVIHIHMHGTSLAQNHWVNWAFLFPGSVQRSL